MVRVIVVDDNPILRTGVQKILEESEDTEVVAGCTTFATLATVTRLRPHVVLLSCRTETWKQDLALLKAVRAKADPGVRVVMMTRSLDEPSLADALHAGVTGFLGQDSSPNELTHAIQLIASGNSVLSRGVAGTVFESVHEPRSARGQGRTALPLSERESEVLDLLARGLSNVQIGNRLLLSPATVKDHVSSIYAKLGVSNRVQAAVLAVQNRSARRHSPDSPGLCAPAC